MNLCTPPPPPGTATISSTTDSNARVLRSDSNDSNDSGFGDDSLPPDEYIQQRLQKMGTLMGFGDEPGIDELAVVVPASSASNPPTYGGRVQSLTSSGSSSLSPPPPNKTALTPFERLQALSLNDHHTSSSLQLVDDAASLPAPNAQFFGATPLSDYTAVNKTFMADDLDYGDDDDDDDDAYVITWEGGQLGLLFKANAADQVVIRRVNKAGTALNLHCARAGDVLIGLNGLSVQGVPFLDVIEQLKRPHFPLKLEFEPMKFNALPPAITGHRGVHHPPPPYLFHNSNSNSNHNQQVPLSPTSSAGTIEVTDQDASFVLVPRDAGRSAAVISTASTASTAAATAAGESQTLEFDVVWDDGPLGCGLKHRNGVPTVKSVSTAGVVSVSVAQIRANDALVLINGYKTRDIGFKSAITMLQRAPKPIHLRFQRILPPAPAPTAAPAPSSFFQLSPQQYEVLWTDGPLGIQIKSGVHGLVFVSRLTGAGNPLMTQLITPGDMFVRIGDVDVAARGIAGAFELLKSVQKPVVLVFEKPLKSQPPAPAPTTIPTTSSTELGASTGPVPSFRKLREEAAAREAAAAAAAAAAASTNTNANANANARPPMPMAVAPVRSITRTQSAGVHQGSGGVRPPMRHPHDSNGHTADESDDAWQTRTAPYPLSHRQQLAQQQQPDRGDVACDDRSDNADSLQLPTERSALPRFSDIEAGRVIVSTEVTALPPPPSYLDMFTQSGRSLDPVVLDSIRAAHASQQLESQSGESASVSSAPPPLPMPLPANETDAFTSLPPPPQYATFFGSPSDAADGGGSLASAAYPPTTRLQELRQQYIEAQRKRNATSFSGTVMSSYSDLDDSDVMRQRPLPPPGALNNGNHMLAAHRAPLPLPELTVRWSDGPLGITFKRKNGQIVVSRLTGAGLSPGIEQLRTGDWLVAFNGYATESLRLSETMELLKRLPKPIDMRFVVQ